MIRLFQIHQIWMLIICLAFLLDGTASAWGASNNGRELRMPFQPGEKLTFELKWTVIPAGTAVLEVRPMATIDGINTYHFVLEARTNRFLDAFYKVRDRIDAYAHLDMTASVLYIKKQREGSVKKDVKVTFDHRQGVARYFKSGKIRKTLTIPAGTFDPLSIFYYSRLLDWKENRRLQRPVSDGKKIVLGEAKIVRRETITLERGIFDTFLVEPDLKHVGGVFEKSNDAKIQLWVTADQRRIPVKISSKVSVGSFVGEIVSMEGVP